MSLPSQSELFKKFDSDHNGIIDINEFTNFILNYFDIVDESENYVKVLKAIFEMCDTESVFHRKDYVIDKKEFTKIYNAIPVKDGRSPKTLVGTFLFNVIDSNGSGKISKKEMSKFTDALGVNKEQAESFMIELDTNKDGKVDLKEFLNWYNEC